MKKHLPRIKKEIISFLKEEDAKVVEKTTVKVAFTISAMMGSFYMMIDNVNAQGHKSHSSHSNDAVPDIDDYDNIDPASEIQTRINFDEDNKTDTIVSQQLDGRSHTFGIEEKSVYSVHAHHFNHSSGGGSS